MRIWIQYALSAEQWETFAGKERFCLLYLKALEDALLQIPWVESVWHSLQDWPKELADRIFKDRSIPQSERLRKWYEETARLMFTSIDALVSVIKFPWENDSNAWISPLESTWMNYELDIAKWNKPELIQKFWLDQETFPLPRVNIVQNGIDEKKYPQINKFLMWTPTYTFTDINKFAKQAANDIATALWIK